MTLSKKGNNIIDSDTRFIYLFLKAIGITEHPKLIVRPGKLVMNSSEEKAKIMSRLPNLRNAEDIYRKLSVRDDYTLEERELIKEWVHKAEE